MQTKIGTKKYVITFIITAIVFFGAIFTSNYFSGQRIEELKLIENKISLDILSSETQFALLKDSSCKAIDHGTAFSEELTNLSQKLEYMEETLGTKDADVISLKKYYSLLEIKDYLLVGQVNEKCGIKPITIIYFYSNQGDCNDCKKEGYVLTKLREEYPDLRIYSFDYNLDLSAVKTMKSIYQIKSSLPALVIGGEPYYGFKNVGDVENLSPQLKKLREARDKALLEQQSATTTGTQATKQ
ncbi:MAG: hypothetical protein PHS95_01630 [Candidatus Pacebacteria bacterium]|nr:hypothetical protein [Candidatus Paceibacterota bacterium]